MAARNVSLTEHLASFVDRQVSTGRHQNASEVVREALRRYESAIEAEHACVEMIRGIAREGREAIRRGDFALIDEDEARDALYRRVTGRVEMKPTSARRGRG